MIDNEESLILAIFHIHLYTHSLIHNEESPVACAPPTHLSAANNPRECPNDFVNNLLNGFFVQLNQVVHLSSDTISDLLF